LFDKIAADWARKRKKPWEPFIELFESNILKLKSKKTPHFLSNQSLFVDLGAGSGRHSKFFQKYCDRLIELDESREMLRLNTDNKMKIQASMESLPFRKNTFSGVFSIAALHHVKELKSREKCISEIIRVGKKSAFVSITVWRFYQKKFKLQFLDQIKQCPPLKQGKTGDVIVPWTVSKKGENLTIDRFYHLFRGGEFRSLLKRFEMVSFCSMGKGDAKDNFYFFGKTK
jgi:tRNA (uracil-5-)-methyltransferase TRM9